MFGYSELLPAVVAFNCVQRSGAARNCPASRVGAVLFRDWAVHVLSLWTRSDQPERTDGPSRSRHRRARDDRQRRLASRDRPVAGHRACDRRGGELPHGDRHPVRHTASEARGHLARADRSDDRHKRSSGRGPQGDRGSGAGNATLSSRHLESPWGAPFADLCCRSRGGTGSLMMLGGVAVSGRTSCFVSRRRWS